MSTAPAFGVITAPGHWAAVDFISDLHLQAAEAGTFQAWARYMDSTPADAIFILGDLFEAWVGDDAAAVPGSFEERCARQLSRTAARKAVHFMRGNRDFLVGRDWLQTLGVHDLADPTVLHAFGQRCLLSHGDELCTDDHAYQRFRQQVRTPEWQSSFLALPLAQRQAMARHMRAESAAHQTEGVYAQIDIPMARGWLQAAGAHTLVHGHTHAPGDQQLPADAEGQHHELRVLSDWHIDTHTRRCEVLRLSAGGWQRIGL